MRPDLSVIGLLLFVASSALPWSMWQEKSRIQGLLDEARAENAGLLSALETHVEAAKLDEEKTAELMEVIANAENDTCNYYTNYADKLRQLQAK